MENKENINNQNDNQQTTQEQKYNFPEAKVIENKEVLFDLTNELIQKTRNAIIDAWKIKIYNDKNEQENNPFSTIVEMLEWYINQFKEYYAKYRKEHNLSLSSDEKKIVNDIESKEEGEKPIKLVHLKQVKDII